MKEMLYNALDALPNPAEQSVTSQSVPLTGLQAQQQAAADQQFFTEYVEEFDQSFLHFCETELLKINTFFAEKLAEATRKFSDLKAELNITTIVVAVIGGGKKSGNSVDTRMYSSVPGPETDKNILSTNSTPTSIHHQYHHQQLTQSQPPPRTILEPNPPVLLEGRKRAKKIADLKLAFSEFYLSLVLLQNYQELNFTGFRKILKKHDKLLNTSSGSRWRQANVDGARFYICKDVIRLIEETENLFTNSLENGDRSKAMKRLRVPPLTGQQSLWTTFRVGLFSGAFTILLIVVMLSSKLIYKKKELYFCSELNYFYFTLVFLPPNVSDSSSSSSSTNNNRHLNFGVMCRLFRGPFFIWLFILLIGFNVYGWRTSGVNHVLIFELNPRDHISEQHLFEVGFCFAVIWTLSLLGYLYAPSFGLNPNIFPLINVGSYVLFLFNPIRAFKHNARFWLIRILVS